MNKKYALKTDLSRQKSKDEAVWQYLKNRGDFEGRVNARLKGRYRNTEADLTRQFEKEYYEALVNRTYHKIKSSIMNEIDKERLSVRKILLWCWRRLNNTLFPSYKDVRANHRTYKEYIKHQPRDELLQDEQP